MSRTYVCHVAIGREVEGERNVYGEQSIREVLFSRISGIYSRDLDADFREARFRGDTKIFRVSILIPKVSSVLFLTLSP